MEDLTILKERIELKKFEKSCQDKYDAYLALSNSYSGEKYVITKDENEAKTIIQTDNGLLIKTDYPQDESSIISGLTSYQGFTPVMQDGVTKLVYTDFICQSLKGSDFRPALTTATGFMRDDSGVFLKLHGSSNDHSNKCPVGSDLTSDDVMDIYNSMIHTFAEAEQQMGDN